MQYGKEVCVIEKTYSHPEYEDSVYQVKSVNPDTTDPMTRVQFGEKCIWSGWVHNQQLKAYEKNPV